ncbi:YfcE family phosphodiesterase [Chloroflexota bacterium]
MLVGLIADTHIPDHVKELPQQLERVFHGVDLILHAGDIYVTSVLDQLEYLAPVLAAEGDDDYGAVRKDKRFKNEHILTVEGITIWLLHEYEIRSRDGLVKFVTKSWGRPEKHPDVIVFGHTHRATVENGGNALQVNPGSATFPNYKCELGTVALLTVSSGKAEARIIQLQ